MILNQIIKVLFYFCGISGLLMFLPGNILLNINPRTFRHSLPKSLDQYKSVDNFKVVHFDEIGPLYGPESIAIDQHGRMVTGTFDGYLYEINTKDDSYRRLLKLVKRDDCAHSEHGVEFVCGRPLGLKFDSNGVLFVVEPSFGVFTVDDVFGENPQIKLVFRIEQTQTLPGGESRFIDDLAIEERPNRAPIIYMTDVSTRFNFNEFVMILFGSEYGRVLRYDMETKNVDTIADGLFFPNGIEITANNEALLFVESASKNIWRYMLKGERNGTLEMIRSQLPSEPDNIRISQNGQTYLVALLKPRSLLLPNEFDYYIRKPLLRKLVARSAHLFGNVLHSLGTLIGNQYCTDLGYRLKTLQFMISTLFPSNGGMILEIDFNGNIVNSIYSTDSEDFGLMSEIHEVKSENVSQRVFYIGSFTKPYLRKVTMM